MRSIQLNRFERVGGVGEGEAEAYPSLAGPRREHGASIAKQSLKSFPFPHLNPLLFPPWFSYARACARENKGICKKVEVSKMGILCKGREHNKIQIFRNSPNFHRWKFGGSIVDGIVDASLMATWLYKGHRTWFPPAGRFSTTQGKKFWKGERSFRGERESFFQKVSLSPLRNFLFPFFPLGVLGVLAAFPRLEQRKKHKNLGLNFFLGDTILNFGTREAIMKYSLIIMFAAAMMIAGCGGEDKSEDSNFCMKRGEEELSRGEFKEAIISFEKAVLLDPDMAAAHGKLALIYDFIYSDTEQARHHYNRCLELEVNPQKKEQYARWVKQLEQRTTPGDDFLTPDDEQDSSQRSAIALQAKKDEELLKDIALQKSELEQKRLKLESEIEKSTALEVENSKLKRELKQIQEMINLLEDEGAVSLEEYQNLKKKITQQQNQIAVANNAKEEYHKEVIALSEKLQKSQQDNIDLQAQLDQARKDVVASPENDNFKEKYYNLLRNAKRLSKAAQKLKKRYMKIDEQLKEANKKLAEYRARAGKSSRDPAFSTVPRPTTYTVKEGDTLRKIATRMYGDPKMSQDIYNANRDKIEKIDEIKMGTVLRIP